MLTHLFLTSFRGIENLQIQLSERTYIQGANGSGKTHILDAIHLLSGSTLMYGNTMRENGNIVSTGFMENGLLREFRFFSDEKRDIFSIQGIRTSKPKYIQTLPWRTIYISPFDMNLLYFAPSMRREEIDGVLSQAYAQFPKVKKDYDLVMRSRNALLKKIRDGDASATDLDFWDQKFAELAELYNLYRSRFVDFLHESIPRFPSFFSSYPIEFVYENSALVRLNEASDIRGGIIHYLEEHRSRDILTGHTHIGPHRDDWGFFVRITDQQKVPVQEYLSRGEMKMLLLGLKMVEAHFLTKTLGVPVILLIDDIFAELDEKNSEIFLDSLIQYQVILTSQKPLPNHEKHHDFICINLQDS